MHVRYSTSFGFMRQGFVRGHYLICSTISKHHSCFHYMDSNARAATEDFLDMETI